MPIVTKLKENRRFVGMLRSGRSFAKVFLWCAVAQQVSCASFSLNDPILGIDSEPRGILVYENLDSRKPMGKTPLLALSQGQPSEKLYFGMPDGRRLLREHPCQVRWFSGLMGNIGLGGLLGPWATGLGLAWDFLKTGKGYDCQKFPMQTFSEEELRGKPEACLRLLVVPPKHYDEAVSDYLAVESMRRMSAETNHCLRFADFNKTKQMLRYLNFDHQQAVTMDKLGMARGAELGRALKSSHIVFLKTAGEQTTFQIKPEIFDLVSQVKVSSRELAGLDQLSILKKDGLEAVERQKLLVKSVSFIPNALSFAIAHDFRFNYELKQGVKLVGEPTKVNNIPGFLANWSLTSVDHPRGYDRWDLALKVFPSISSSYQQRTYKTTDNDDELNISSNLLQFLYLTGMMNAGLSVHTPAGALSFHAGGGMVYVYAQDQLVTTTQLAPAFRAGWRYTAFLSQDVFTFFETSRSRIAVDSGLAPISHELLAIREWTTISLGFGYFFPTLRSYARSAIQ